MFGRRPVSALALAGGLLAVASIGAAPAAAAPSPAFSFHGTATDDAGRLQGTPTATFDQTAPTGTTDHTQTGPSALVPTGPADPNQPYWIAWDLDPRNCDVVDGGDGTDTCTADSKVFEPPPHDFVYGCEHLTVHHQQL